MNPPLRLEEILARLLVDRCPGVQACPPDSALGHGATLMGPPVEPHAPAEVKRWELCQVVPYAPHSWAGIGSPFDGSALRLGLCLAAQRVLGFAVTLDRGEADQVWAVPAASTPNDQEQ